MNTEIAIALRIHVGVRYRVKIIIKKIIRYYFYLILY
jgi:hypothetical protein